MMRICGRRFVKIWLYLQVYVSLILLCLSGYFLVQLLYCQSQLDLIDTFQLDLYACIDLCPNYPSSYFPYDAFTCCTDTSFSDCVDKYQCLKGMVQIFSQNQNTNGITMACLVSAVPLLVLVHLIIRFCVRNQRRNNRNRVQAQEQAGMPALESFTHNDQENQCSICLEKFHNEKAIVLNCGHIFHNQCIRQWGTRKKTCPVCRNQQ